MKRIMKYILQGLFIISLACTLAFADDQEKVEIASASASSTYGTSRYYGGPDYAIDEDTTTYWLGAYNAKPWWIMFDLGQSTKVDKINLIWYSSYYTPTDYDIQISDDAATWEDLHSGLEAVYNANGEDIDINRGARYIRLYINEAYRYGVLREFSAFASINLSDTIRFQGTLKDTAGAPIDGIHAITFRLYNSETGGDPAWEEVQQGIDITSGVLDVELGSVTPFDISFNMQYWLSVEIESDGEMMPRFKLTSVPYAMSAK